MLLYTLKNFSLLKRAVTMVGAWEPCQRGLSLDILWLCVRFLLWYMKPKIDDATHGKTKLSTGATRWHTATYKAALTGQNNAIREALTCDFNWNAFLINAWSQIMSYHTIKKLHFINFKSSKVTKRWQPIHCHSFLSSFWFVYTLV